MTTKPRHPAARYEQILLFINRVYSRRRRLGRPVWHLPRRARALSEKYLAALAWEREQTYEREIREHFAAR